MMGMFGRTATGRPRVQRRDDDDDDDDDGGRRRRSKRAKKGKKAEDEIQNTAVGLLQIIGKSVSNENDQSSTC